MDELIKRISELTNAHIIAHGEEGMYDAINALIYMLAANLHSFKDATVVLHCMEQVLELATSEDPPFRVFDASAFDGLTKQ